MVRKGLILPVGLKIEEIRVDVSSRPPLLFQNQEGYTTTKAGKPCRRQVNLLILACLVCIGRLRIDINPLIKPAKKIAGRLLELRVCLRPLRAVGSTSRKP